MKNRTYCSYKGDTMDFPRYVFTEKGEEKCTLGTYGTAIVEDQEEFDAAMKAGFKKDVTDLFKEEIDKKTAKKNLFKKDKKAEEDDF